jgi:hypothetical protein
MESMREDVFRLAVAPWKSIYRSDTPERVTKETQDEIDFCLYHCPYADTECCNCLDGGTKEKQGRPNVGGQLDLERLKEMLRLKIPQAKICRELGVTRQTVYNYKKKLGVI